MHVLPNMALGDIDTIVNRMSPVSAFREGIFLVLSVLYDVPVSFCLMFWRKKLGWFHSDSSNNSKNSNNDTSIEFKQKTLDKHLWYALFHLVFLISLEEILNAISFTEKKI